MLKVSKSELSKLEKQYPGIGETIAHYESQVLPACMHCGSSDTAVTSCGLVGFSIAVAAATTKVKLFPNGQGGRVFCNACGTAGEKTT